LFHFSKSDEAARAPVATRLLVFQNSDGAAALKGMTDRRLK
jgi:hypothetical protein